MPQGRCCGASPKDRAQSHSWDKGSSTIPCTTGTSTPPWAPAELQGGSEQWCLYLVLPAFFSFLSVLGSPAFIAPEASYSSFHSKRSQTTKSCWQQLSLSGMRQQAPSHLLTPNKCSFPVIPRTMWGCRAMLAGLAPPKLPE